MNGEKRSWRNGLLTAGSALAMAVPGVATAIPERVEIQPIAGSELNPASLNPRYDVLGAGINTPVIIPNATIESARQLGPENNRSYRNYIKFAIRQATRAERQGGEATVEVFRYDLDSNKNVRSGPLGPDSDTAMVVEDLNSRVIEINSATTPEKAIDPEISDRMLTRRVPFSESRALMRAFSSYRILTNKRTGKNIQPRDIVAALQQPNPKNALRKIDPSLSRNVPILVNDNFSGIGVRVSWTGTPAQPSSSPKVQ